MSKPYGRENRKAFLALADGTIFEGEGFGGKKQKDAPAVGEVVFNTSMYGYQEILTDPSYAGQIMTFTYPHIGNVGCNKEDVESKRIYVEGLIIRNESLIASNFRAEKSLSEYLELNSIMGLSRIDTRSLVQHIRDKGAQMGAMACCERREVDTLVDFARANGSMLGKDYVFAVTCEKPYSWEELPWTSGEMHSQKISQARLSGRPHLIALDCGIKFNILRILTECGFRVTVVPAGFTSAEIMELRPDALFLSNGPGDPAAAGPSPARR